MKRLMGSVLSLFLILLLPATAAQAASVKGKIAFEGAAPAPETFKMDADANCKLMHPTPVASDEVIVNANGTLKDVFVYVKEGVTGKHEAPKTPVVFDQKGCLYHPKVFGIMVGQPLEIVNSDNTLHNVHSLAANSPQFNLGMPIQNMKLKKKFDKPEVMVKIKCDVHPWMGAHAGVLDHPFYAVSSETGEFEIKDLPAGEYTIEAVHAKYGAQTQKITVADPSADVNFSFKG